jgi:D-3-phosphoglycerate dehydrogenase
MGDATVAVTDYNFPDLSVERRELAGVADVVHAGATTPEEVVEAAEGAHALLVQYAEITDEVLRELDDLAVVGRYGIGVDNVDVESATDRGVTVVNVPSYCEDEVAEHALALLLTCERRVVQFDDAVKDGRWDWKLGKPVFRLRGRTLGLAGFGKIPRRVVEKTGGLGLDYVAYDPYVDADEMAELGVEKVDFENLLARSDAISIHVPLTDETRNLFDADAFAAVDDDAVLVNTSRGKVVDDDALADALAAGKVRAAGLDVLPEEPPEESPLLDRDEVVLTPHVAWYSEDSIDDLRRTLARDVRRILHGEKPENPVNDLDSGRHR